MIKIIQTYCTESIKMNKKRTNYLLDELMLIIKKLGQLIDQKEQLIDQKEKRIKELEKNG